MVTSVTLFAIEPTQDIASQPEKTPMHPASRTRFVAPTVATALCVFAIWCNAAPDPVAVNRAKSTPFAAGDPPLQIATAFDPVDGNVNSMANASSLEKELVSALNAPVHVVSSRSLKTIATGARAGSYDALWVVSTIAVTAAKNAKYEIIGFDGRSSSMALLVAPNISKVEDLRGRYVYLPQEDSLASVVGVALLKDHGLKLKDWLTVPGDGTYDVGPFALESNISSATVVPEATARSWIGQHADKGRILEVSRPVPGQTLVVRKDLPAAKKRQLSDWAAGKSSMPALLPPDAEVFKYVTGISQ